MKLASVTLVTGLATLAVLVALPFRSNADDGGQNRVRLEASLTATDADPGASGRARFEARDDRSELRVDVDDVASTDFVDVLVNGSFIGTIALDEEGSGRLELNSRNGDQVPALQEGDEIEVVDATDGTTVILTGTLSPSN